MLKNYEKHIFLLSSCLLFILLVILFFIYTMQTKIYFYSKFIGTVWSKDFIEVVVTEEQLKTLYQNRFLYFDNQKKSFQVKSVIREVMVRKDQKYHDVYLACSLGEDVKEKDMVEFVLKKEKRGLFEIFRVIWDGD